MKLLFVLQYPGYLRYFDSVLAEFTARGHQVTLVFDLPHKQPEGLAALEDIDGKIEVLGRTPSRPDLWAPVARGVRGTIDYVRYLHPRFADSPYLRERMRKVLPPITRFLGRWDTSTARRTAWLVSAFEACERAIPSSPVLESFLCEVGPDVLVVSPLVTDQSTQVDLIKAARAVGIPSALCVASWDHLTTKGLMRIQPDLVALWNRDQRREALDFHGASDDRIVVTGAQCFDRWFDRSPSRSRDVFCAQVGVRSDRPFVVFVGSTASISAPDAETAFVKRWIEAVRCGPGSLGEVGIVIRPHPYNSVHWRDVDLSDFHNVAVFPRHGANPVDNDDRADYYDTLHHAAIVVGINTSAMIEAGIQDRPVCTVLDPAFDDTQTGTLHFRYLLPENGGPLQQAANLEEHTRQLSAVIDEGRAPSARQFIETFVRPYGLDTAATPRLVDALLALQLRMPTVSSLPFQLWPARATLWGVAVVTYLTDFHERRKELHRARRRYAKAAWRYYKTKRKTCAQVARPSSTSRQEDAGAVRRAGGRMTGPTRHDPVSRGPSAAPPGWHDRLGTLRDSTAYRKYEDVRNHVLRLLEFGHARRQTGHAPSDYWSGELSKFEYMLDASPLVIEKLRHHTHNLTGLHANQYRQSHNKYKRRFAEKLGALRALDEASLWVPEAALLGGFGYEIDGQLVNIDTLKFYEVLIALHTGAVLNAFQQTHDRKLVWEIGAGWGGFPYQFKTLCPNVTYVITDFPELFLFSATYLQTAFPDARVRFYGEVPPEETFDDWTELDFIFVPDTFHGTVRPAQVDLTINMVSFQEMTTRQVEAYVRRAFELKCPYLYSLNRDRSRHNAELSNVRAIMGQTYWPHPVAILPVSYTKMLNEDPDKEDSGYKHV
ncbi:MAG: putative sugar O-methyltransferase, partial [Acidobacteriota bacterium]|nr:putative sugar O-methyltransferase [Acidobacteriota bacterium]